MHARACFKPGNALALILEFNPAFEDVHKLKIRLMRVRLTGELSSSRCTDNVRIDPAFGCLFDPQITILVKRTKTTLEYSIFCV